ncbi:MAG: endolytic transglycosylase MltG [Candidatus Gottesmanbacteria bacterium]
MMRILLRLLLILIILIALVGGVSFYFLSPVENINKPVIFTLQKDDNKLDAAIKLKEQKLIRNVAVFSFLLTYFAADKKILPGGYRLNSNMNAWQVMEKITKKPDLVWVVIREGLRKEQVAIVLAKALGWTDKQRSLWLDNYTSSNPEYIEGVYFPDTYLIPVDENGADIVRRFINNFNAKMAPLFPEFAKKDILWTTGIKIASLIQREAGGSADMPIIAGVIWNRLNKGMKLEIDATMQYTRGEQNDNWWGPIDLEEKLTDSPYNTYLYKGLPPTPICNPGLEAIKAALNPAETDCIFYLHDAQKQIHCAKTYEEHKRNIIEFLN